MSLKKVRYAVMGLGHIAQAAVLPAFQHARTNSQLRALVSGSRMKLSKLSAMYGVAQVYGYDQYDECLRSGRAVRVKVASRRTRPSLKLGRRLPRPRVPHQVQVKSPTR